MIQRRMSLFCTLCLLISAPLVKAQGSFEWLTGGTYDASIPSPESVLGYQIGDYLTDHHQMIDYIRRLAESSDRVRIQKYASSVERRDMYLVFISSPENMKRLEEIRNSIARLADPRTISQQEVDRIVAGTPPIGWLNYANDGGETAAFEAGLQVAYQLAAGTDPLSLKILQNVVTILNPAANPDSHQTFVAWMKANTIGHPGTPDPAASEHTPQWFISSDGNHYLIDLNRDAFALTQVETQAIARMLHHWHPQVWIDNHGQPDEYTFAPFTSPVNLNYPSSHLKWATEIGKKSASYFDKRGWSYVKDETYDLYYPGYWDSYPAFNGAVASTYETNAGGDKGMIWEKPDGSTVVFRDGIQGHFLADLATLETLADNRQAILRDYYAFFKTGMDEVGGEEYKTYVLVPGRDPGRAADLAALLMRHEIEVYRTTRPQEANAETYFERQVRSHDVPAGSYVVPLRQPKKRLAKVLLEPDPKMEESFLEKVEAIRERNSKLGRGTHKEGLGFYDVTAWALPLTFGVEALFLPDELTLPASARLTDPPAVEGGVEGGQAGYAYLFTYDTDAGAHLLGRLLQEDYRVAIATRPFRNSGRDYPIGTLIVRVQRNSSQLHDRIRELAREYGTRVYATDTAWGEEGISLGSRKVINLTRPRILVMTNRPTQAVAFGAVYSLLDQRFDLEFTAARAEYFRDLDLYRYNVMVFPDGSASGYRSLLGDAGAERLREWIRNGGVFVGLKAGAEYALMPGVELADAEIRRDLPPASEGGAPRPVESLPGTIFRVRVNPEYYLGFGYPSTIAVQLRGSQIMLPSHRGTNVVVFPDHSYVQGHEWDSTEEILAGKSYLEDVPLGRGKVILFADDPTFRAYWRGLDRLFLSSILLAPSF